MKSHSSLLAPQAELAEDVVLSIQGVTKKPPNPPPNPPRWLAKILPGAQWSAAAAAQADGVDDDASTSRPGRRSASSARTPARAELSSG